MDKNVLANKQMRQYSMVSRYSGFPLYYHRLDDKYVYGTTAYLSDDTAYILHKVERNETYDILALQYYNNPTYYWIICSYNHIQDPYTRPKEGEYIKIPSISAIQYKR